MPRTFITEQILDAQVQQIVITRTQDDQGNTQVRVRSNVTVTLADSVDPTRKTTMNLNLNKTVQELTVGPAVNAIRLAVLNALKTQIQ